MHFTIPYTEEIIDSNDKKLIMFKIYINGAHHCSARYNRFHKLYEDLKQKFIDEELPYFPPKKLLKLNESQLEDRRESLEYFLQKVSSSSKLNSDEFHEFLKTCQKETKKIISEPVNIPIYLMDGSRYDLDILTTDHTKTVFDSFACLVNLPHRITQKFGLFFMEIHSDNQISIVRKLQDFEYPYVSMAELQKHCNCRIVVRKNVWSLELESDIDLNKMGIEILFAQVIAEINMGWIIVPDKARRNRIAQLTDRKAQKEALHLARTLDFYGYIQLHGHCICSRPFPNTEAVVSAGNFELVFREQNDKILEKYCLTRIKGWKISTTLRDNLNVGNNQLRPSLATLTFEYLDLDTKKLDEVTITNSQTDQIILLSMSLKNMAEEYISIKAGIPVSDTREKKPSKIKPANQVDYKPGLMCSLYIGDGDL